MTRVFSLNIFFSIFECLTVTDNLGGTPIRLTASQALTGEFTIDTSTLFSTSLAPNSSAPFLLDGNKLSTYTITLYDENDVAFDPAS